MFSIFEQEKVAAIGMFVCFFLSLLIRLLLAALYNRMIAETDNMATTSNKLLKQCKLKFTNCYQLNNGVPNVPIFVEKFLGRLALGPFSFSILYHLSGQLMLLSVVFSGMGVCRSIIAGNMFGEILPFYIFSLAELYLFLSLGTLLDIKGKRKLLKVNLVDYLENHLSNRMQVTRVDMQMLYGAEKKMPVMQRNLELIPIASRMSEKNTEAEGTWTEIEEDTETYPEMPGHAVTLKSATTVSMEAEEAEALEELLKEFLSLS